MGVTVTLDRVPEIVEAITRLAKTRVLVGIPADKVDRRGEAGGASPINNAALGYIHENGAPEVGIPARPFLRPGVENVQSETNAGLRKAGVAALEGRTAEMDQQFNRIGLLNQASVRAKITDGPFEPLKPATLAARRRRGRTGTKPLLDTGQLRNAINYVIRGI